MSNGNKELLSIPQCSGTGASSSDCFCHNQDTHWGGCLTPLHRCGRHILQPPQNGQLSKSELNANYDRYEVFDSVMRIPFCRISVWYVSQVKLVTVVEGNSCPIIWGCSIYRLHLCRSVRLPHRVSCIWHWTIWRWSSSNAGSLGNAEYSLIEISPRSTMAWTGTNW